MKHILVQFLLVLFMTITDINYRMIDTKHSLSKTHILKAPSSLFYIL